MAFRELRKRRTVQLDGTKAVRLETGLHGSRSPGMTPALGQGRGFLLPNPPACEPALRGFAGWDVPGEVKHRRAGHPPRDGETGSIPPGFVWPGGLKASGAGSGLWETPSRGAGSIAPPPSRREMPPVRSSAGTSRCPWDPGEGHGVSPKVGVPAGTCCCRSRSLRLGPTGRGSGLRFLARDGEGCPRGTGSQPGSEAESVGEGGHGGLSRRRVLFHQGRCRRGASGNSCVAA